MKKIVVLLAAFAITTSGSMALAKKKKDAEKAKAPETTEAAKTEAPKAETQAAPAAPAEPAPASPVASSPSSSGETKSGWGMDKLLAPFSGKEDGFALSAGLGWAYGSARSATGLTEARAINTFELNAMPGWQMGAIAPRLMLSYGMTGQTTDPTTVNNTNVRGSGYLLGLGATYLISNWHILGGVEFFGNYTQGEKTTSGDTSVLGLPFGFRLGGSWFWSQNFSADILFHYVQYSENKVGSVTSSISDNRMRFMTLGIGISYQL